ncbi:MAG TPA: TlpA disulfide reductase family protein [Anaeromyxobacteraceae bacterium]|nr:TlpA disulfide reductase family protein [Anaeromyxobacteraceae bacterium]
MKSWLKLVILAVLAIVAVEMYMRDRGGGELQGTPAPAFTLPAVSGGAVSLASLQGKVVALNFWATWCPPCKAEIPDFAAVYASSAGKCVEFLGVAEESGSHDEIEAAARTLGINYPVLVDEDGRVGEAFGIPGYPRTFLIDVNGRVRKVFEGMVSRAELEGALAPLLTEAPASCPKSKAL